MLTAVPLHEVSAEQRLCCFGALAEALNCPYLQAYKDDAVKLIRNTFTHRPCEPRVESPSTLMAIAVRNFCNFGGRRRDDVTTRRRDGITASTSARASAASAFNPRSSRFVREFCFKNQGAPHQSKAPSSECQVCIKVLI